MIYQIFKKAYIFQWHKILCQIIENLDLPYINIESLCSITLINNLVKFLYYMTQYTLRRLKNKKSYFIATYKIVEYI